MHAPGQRDGTRNIKEKNRTIILIYISLELTVIYAVFFISEVIADERALLYRVACPQTFGP